MRSQFDVIILGAGAAGLMCAIEAGKRGRRVAVLERAERIGKKILISGGGRCNFTNLHCRPENFISANPHFAKSALARYTPVDFIAMVEKHGIAYHEKTLGQLFCDGPAQQIVAMLEAECRAAGVRIQTNVEVKEVSREDGFLLRAGDDEFRAESLVVATGGLSIPKMGATAFGYDLARQFGLNIVQPRPALVPLTLNKDDTAHFCDLAGVSAEVVASIGAQSFREKMLITHRGLSGPAILQISSYWKPGQPVSLDLAPEHELTAALRDSKARRDLPSAKAAFRTALPNRFAERWLDLHPPQGWTNNALDELERRAHNWQITPDGTEGYAKAEVTAGGVDTNELSAKTMESRKVPGLFFIGEVVDVTGHLGGFNFQWAWASGFSAGQAA
jgi:predicted Rossmann fold flavoprotein